jgi:DNA replication and repair protein RecF
VLKQRNSLLKQSLDGDIDRSQLEVWNQQLILTGVRTIRRRARIIDRLMPIARAWHERISGKTESLTIHYQPSIPVTADDPEVIQQAFAERIASRQVAELSLGTSLVGPHRDDIELAIDDTLAKSYGSQGQQRTLVLAIKLAELELIEQIVGEPPLLLLDDVLAELDLHRQNQLLSAIADRFQTIVTTTHLGSFDRDWLNASQILHVTNGKIETGNS